MSTTKCSSSSKSCTKFTCFSHKQLRHIATQINNAYSRKISTKSNKDKLWKDINYFMLSYCKSKDELCWVNNSELNLGTLRNVMKPSKPVEWKHNPRAWLSNIDIYDVLSQYSERFRTFYFVGVFPIDYDYKLSPGNCIVNELCNINISQLLKEKKKQIGIVFNLDKHHEPGSHWVAVNIGLHPSCKNFGCFYYDSNAQDPPSEVEHLFEVVVEQLHQIYPKRKIKITHNTLRKQFKNTECGMFCILFIIKCMRHYKFKQIIEIDEYDDEVFNYRNVLFI